MFQTDQFSEVIPLTEFHAQSAQQCKGSTVITISTRKCRPGHFDTFLNVVVSCYRCYLQLSDCRMGEHEEARGYCSSFPSSLFVSCNDPEPPWRSDRYASVTADQKPYASAGGTVDQVYGRTVGETDSLPQAENWLLTQRSTPSAIRHLTGQW